MSKVEAEHSRWSESAAGAEEIDEEDAELRIPVLNGRHAPSSPQPVARGPAPTPPQAETPKPTADQRAKPEGEAKRGDDGSKGGEDGKRGPSRRLAVLALVLLAGVSAGAYYGYHWWTEGRFLVSTDDAYVKADSSIIATKIAGYVAEVPIRDNQHVHKGDLLSKIDDRDYVIAVQAARNKAATQDATIVRLKEQAKAQDAVIAQAKAQVTSAQAGLVRANADFDRAQILAKSSYGSQQTFDQARASRDQAVASVEAARAAQLSTEANLAVLNAQVDEAVHVRAELQSSLDQAQLNLSYTEVRAPFDGVVGNKAVQLGQYVQTGTRMLSLVPLDTVYIEANYKETQLKGIQPGQSVDVAVDAAGGREFTGTVDSIAPASGSQFSLLPPENATGNFTKIVQRVPVRIRVSGEAVSSGMLRPGLSVATSVHTKAGADTQTVQSGTGTGAGAMTTGSTSSIGGAQAAPVR